MQSWKIIVALLSSVAGIACAQSYPNKPVRVIIPYPPGEAADFIARVIGPTLSERMGQQFVVENRAGASGQIGMELLKNSPADGYTIGIGQGGMALKGHGLHLSWAMTSGRLAGEYVSRRMPPVDAFTPPAT